MNTKVAQRCRSPRAPCVQPRQASTGDILPAEVSRTGVMFDGEAEVARLGCLSPRADRGAWMPRGEMAATCGRPPKRARALCGASLAALAPVLALPAVRLRALSVGLVRSLGVAGARLEVTGELDAGARALKDIPEPAVVATDVCWRFAAAEVEEASLATVRCTVFPDVFGLAWLGTLSIDFVRGRGEKSRSCDVAATLLGTFAVAATHEPDEDPPRGGDTRRRGVMSTLGVCARCPGGDGEAACRDLDVRAVENGAGAVTLPLPGLAGCWRQDEAAGTPLAPGGGTWGVDAEDCSRGLLGAADGGITTPAVQAAELLTAAGSLVAPKAACKSTTPLGIERSRFSSILRFFSLRRWYVVVTWLCLFNSRHRTAWSLGNPKASKSASTSSSRLAWPGIQSHDATEAS